MGFAFILFTNILNFIFVVSVDKRPKHKNKNLRHTLAAMDKIEGDNSGNLGRKKKRNKELLRKRKRVESLQYESASTTAPKSINKGDNKSLKHEAIR